MQAELTLNWVMRDSIKRIVFALFSSDPETSRMTATSLYRHALGEASSAVDSLRLSTSLVVRGVDDVGVLVVLVAALLEVVSLVVVVVVLSIVSLVSRDVIVDVASVMIVGVSSEMSVTTITNRKCHIYCNSYRNCFCNVLKDPNA